MLNALAPTQDFSSSVKEDIQKEIDSHPVVLFMKGTKYMPQCGFSAAVVQVLMHYGLEDFRDINVLSSPELRQGIKDFTNWPTVPQLYVKGEFIGGCDIVREMHESGELKDVLNTI
jgi:monothiol glutaredoxin